MLSDGKNPHFEDWYTKIKNKIAYVYSRTERDAALHLFPRMRDDATSPKKLRFHPLNGETSLSKSSVSSSRKPYFPNFTISTFQELANCCRTIDQGLQRIHRVEECSRQLAVAANSPSRKKD